MVGMSRREGAQVVAWIQEMATCGWYKINIGVWAAAKAEGMVVSKYIYGF
jgi:hypothetical protein